MNKIYITLGKYEPYDGEFGVPQGNNALAAPVPLYDAEGGTSWDA